MSETRDRLLRAAKNLKGWDGPAEVARELTLAGLKTTDQQMANWRTRKVPDRFCHLAAEIIGCSAEWLIFGRAKITIVEPRPKEAPPIHDRQPIAENLHFTAMELGDTERNALRAYVDMLRKNAQVIAEQFGVSTDHVLTSALAPKEMVPPEDGEIADAGRYRPPGAPARIIRTSTQTEEGEYSGEADPAGSNADFERRQEERRARDRRES